MSLEQVYQNDDISTILRKILREEIKEIGVFGEWLTKKDACRYLGGISMNTFDQAVVQSKIEKRKINGTTRIVFRKTDLDKIPVLL